MKSLGPLGFMLCFLFHFNLQAQLPPLHKILPDKAFLFSNLPDKSLIKHSLIENLFAGPASGPVRIRLSPDSYFEGIITERLEKNDNVTTINVKSSNYNGALLSISRILNSNKEYTFTGRIVSLQHGDVLILKKENNDYFFSKEKQSLVIVE